MDTQKFLRGKKERFGVGDRFAVRRCLRRVTLGEATPTNAYALFSSLQDATRVRLIGGSVKFLTAIFLLAMNSCYIVL